MAAAAWRGGTARNEPAHRSTPWEKQFRLLAENVPDVVVHLNNDGWILWISNAVETALGAAPEYWIGRHALELAVVHTESAAERRLDRILDSHSDIGRALVRGADGTKHWIHFHSKAFYDAAGRRDGVVVSCRVIDDEVAAEQKVLQQIGERDNRLRSQLNSAARYVESILPRDLEGAVAVTSRYFPSEELSGDSYDFRWVDDDHLVVYLLDVSGHGVEPALLSVSVHNLLRSGSLDSATLLRPDAVLTELNRLFQMEQHGDQYFTIWYGVYQSSTRRMRYACAGHPPAIVIADGATLDRLAGTSIPIGISQHTEFESHEYSVPDGAQIVLYSDGGLEIGVKDGGHRSPADFAAACARAARIPDWTLDTLAAELRGDSAPAAYEDDCTFVHLIIP